jgi:CRP/FNR family transcriptional regulator
MLRHANQSRKIKGHEDASRAIHGRALVDDCMTCTARNTHGFCALSPSGLKTLDGTSHPITYPDGALVFVEGQHARGAYVLCAGRAKLSTTSRDGKVLILRIAVSGEVLGLSAALSDQPYELTVETSGACHIRFLERQALQGVIQNSPEFGVRASLALSRQIQRAYRDIHELVLARSSTGKLARLLLSWSQNREKPGEEARVPASLTHEEMAQMIGSSRETVTRLLGDLKKRELVRLEGAKLVIRNRAAMEALAA